MVKSIPYEVVKKLDRVEIRSYPKVVLARVDGYGDDGFNLLFKFISGANSQRARILQYQRAALRRQRQRKAR